MKIKYRALTDNSLKNNMSHLRSTVGVMTAFSLVALYLIWNSKGQLVKAYQTPQIISQNETFIICNVNYNDNRIKKDDESAVTQKPLPTIYFVTPTYSRREQIAEMTRLGQTLMHIPNIHWIVADDNEKCNEALNKLLNKISIPYTHIASPMPDLYRTYSNVPRGVSNRRAALNWIKNNNLRDGVLYFGDDDNSFDLDLFTEIRFTKRVSMFPVGLIGLYAVSTPICKDGQVIGFFDSWPAKRKWPVDMAGFAVNLDYLSQSPNATMPYRAGHEEDGFLKSIGLKINEIEPKAKNCTEILVWHTQTKKMKSPTIKIDQHSMSNILSDRNSLSVLLESLKSMGVTHISSNEGEEARITKDGNTKSLHQWLHG